MNILMWHVHGSYTTALLRGRHTYLLPTLPDRGPDGLGRARTWCWPANAVEVTPHQAADAEVDLVLLQRPAELQGLAERWLGGRVPGRDVPAVYLEHNAPAGPMDSLRHPLAGRADIPVVHVTHCNALFWDCGRAPVRVVEHGVVDPGHRYTGELRHAAVVVNEPRRRGRTVGFDLLPRFGETVPLDLFGIGTEALGGQDLPQERLHTEMARRRVYLHPVRWTSLGLTLLEAMHLGMPVVALATTEVVEAVPPEAGVVSNRMDRLQAALREFTADPARARQAGMAARRHALAHHRLEAFLVSWDRVFAEVAG